MKVKFLLTVCLGLNLLAASNGASSDRQTDVRTFWKKFNTAVEKADKNALAEMTKFPLEMPYGVKSVKNKAEFLKRYNEIFKGETDAAKCFPKAKLEKETTSVTPFIAVSKQRPKIWKIRQ